MKFLLFLEKMYILIFNYFLNIICFSILRPFGYLIDQYYILKVWFNFHYKKEGADERHFKNVVDVQNQILDWIKSGSKNKLCTARPGWQAMCLRIPIYKKTLTGIKLNLNEIVSLDEKREILKVEPNVNMGQISAVLTPLGWTLAVVPELNDLTVGGLINGAGLESSSHKYGLFFDICQSLEVVLPNGEVVNCSKENDPDLFNAMQMSHGTIGFLTCAEIKIMPAKKYVKLEYIPVNNLDEAVKVFEKESDLSQNNEFVEGIMFSLNKGVIMKGNLVNCTNGMPVNELGRYYKSWFYKHVETFTKNKEIVTEYIPIRDYYHRHTRSTFWLCEYLLPAGNNILFRYLFGWILPVKLNLFKLIATDWVKEIYLRKQIIQDYVIPIEKLKDTLILSDKITKIYPIWLCGCLILPKPGFGDLFKKVELYVDVGIYGDSPLKNFDPVKAVKEFEQFAIKNRGYQGLYADCYQTREEFNQMFYDGLYSKVRERFGCEKAFPDIYEKVNISARK